MFAALLAVDAVGVGFIFGALSGVAAGIAVVAYAVMQPQRECAGCGELMPKLRKPANTRQMLWGGWTCQKCGCELDRKGQRVES